MMLHIGASHSSNCQIILKLFGCDIHVCCNNLQQKNFKQILKVFGFCSNLFGHK